MALNGAGGGVPVTGVRPVSARHFVRLKIRTLANNFRGQGWRIAVFVSGILIGLWCAASGFLLLALPGLGGSPRIAGITGGFGGALLVLGWSVLPLIFFGVDETLDPARFALLPLPRRTLITGMIAAALVGVPAIAALLATSGLVLTSWLLGGWGAALVAGVGILLGLLLCVAASRAVTSALASMLRSRKVRDLAAILLAVCAALLGPLQIAIVGAVERADWDRLADAARVLGWTPLAAPYTIGLDVALGQIWAVPVKLVITGLAIGGLLRWWSRSLESAMLGGTAGARTTGRTRWIRRPAGRIRLAAATPAGRVNGVPVPGGVAPATVAGRAPEPGPTLDPTAARPSGPASTPARSAGAGADQPTRQLFPRILRWLPRDRYGALVAREARYWWRDTRRRVSLITFAVVGVFVPVSVRLGTRGMSTGPADIDASPVLVSLSMLLVGVLAAVSPANQFGWDGSAYAANVIAGVPGRVELRARVVGFSLYLVPLLVVIAIVLTSFLREPRWFGVLAGSLFAAYGSGLAVTLYVSILSPYALPDTTNPFALNSGAGVTKSAQVLLAMVAGTVLALPMVVATALLGGVWFWLALPVGLGYGLGAVALGVYMAGDVLDRRMPELLVAVTPRR